MDLRARLKRLLPPDALNWLMLNFPIVYKFPIVSFESNMEDEALEDIGCLLATTALLSGDVIECGSSRCGTSIYIARHLASLGIKKPIHALDSYEGFDRGELERERSKGLTSAPDDSFTSTSFRYVVRKLEKLGYDDIIFPVQGLFRDTLPLLAAETRFSFALVDCDLQDSVSYCADTLWPRMVPGAVVAFDDYASDEFRGARLAVDAFVSGQADDISSHGMLNRLYYARKTGGQG